MPEALGDDIRRYFYSDYVSPPIALGQREFTFRQGSGEQQASLWVRTNGREKKIFDPAALRGASVDGIAACEWSADASIVAVGVQNAGAEDDLTFHFIDADDGHAVLPNLEDATWVSWGNSSSRLYYGRIPASTARHPLPRCAVYQRTFSGESHRDILVAAQPEDAAYISVYEPRGSNHVALDIGDSQGHTLSFAPVAGNQFSFVNVFSSKDSRAAPLFNNGKQYFLISAPGQGNRVFHAEDVGSPSEKWSPFYSPHEGALLIDAVFTSSRFLTLERLALRHRVLVHDQQGRYLSVIELEDDSDILSISYDPAADSAYLLTTGFFFSHRLLRVDGKSLDVSLVSEDRGPIDSSQLAATFEHVASRDGTEVPVFLIHRKEAGPAGDNTVILTAYGSFGETFARVDYAGLAAAIVKQGVTYAFAGVRGGGEYGDAWHFAGIGKNKQNSIDDFNAVAAWLGGQGDTGTRRVLAYGSSSGGLLAAAAVVRRPDLFAGLLCTNPLTDMLRYTELGRGADWISEYGDPAELDAFRVLLQYSPYHNVRASVGLPPVLLLVSENDDRVDPAHGFKFVASLQNNIGQTSPVLLLVGWQSGHAGGQSTDAEFDQSVKVHRFIWHIHRH